MSKHKKTHDSVRQFDVEPDELANLTETNEMEASMQQSPDQPSPAKEELYEAMRQYSAKKISLCDLIIARLDTDDQIDEFIRREIELLVQEYSEHGDGYKELDKHESFAEAFLGYKLSTSEVNRQKNITEDVNIYRHVIEHSEINPKTGKKYPRNDPSKSEHDDTVFHQVAHLLKISSGKVFAGYSRERKREKALATPTKAKRAKG
jgi:hypothetical protein